MIDDATAATHKPAATRPAQQIPATVARRLPYSHARRATYGLLWAGWTLLLTVGGFTGLFSGQVAGGMLALVLAAVAGHYDYRIWTWRARRLLFFIVW